VFVAEPDEFLNALEAAELLGVHPQTVYRWCKDGLIDYIQPTPRSRRRYRRSDLLRLLEPKRDEVAS